MFGRMRLDTDAVFLLSGHKEAEMGQDVWQCAKKDIQRLIMIPILFRNGHASFGLTTEPLGWLKYIRSRDDSSHDAAIK